jgi:hypothetical protein
MTRQQLVEAATDHLAQHKAVLDDLVANWHFTDQQMLDIMSMSADDLLEYKYQLEQED